MFARISLLAFFFIAIASYTPISAQPYEIASTGTLKPNGIRHVNVSEAQTLIENYQNIIVLDVRTGREYASGHIEGAANINYFSLSFKRNIGKLDTSKTYLIHCKTGHRSGRAAPIMKAAGIENVIHMDGGFDAWKDAGLPIATN